MFFKEPAFGRLTSVSPPSHPYPRYQGPWSEYMKYLRLCDSADRLALLPAAGTPAWMFGQMRNVCHSLARDRGISDKRGPNGLRVTLDGPSFEIPTSEILTDADLQWFEAFLNWKRDVQDCYGCILSSPARVDTNALGRAAPACVFRDFRAWTASLKGLMVKACPHFSGTRGR